ncbi:sulfatase family protein [Pontiella sulfatireligans]|uniref:Arylsulfatase n=1 Tax=Pontiella sulfatireligans TaxID=2750658 RepID=A0A6C2URE1_9BACT|nr:sulfatase-like hydrolase/transferase [Pontiella sulfatireligans]SPS74536.1 sulfatase S1_44 [Kiritimatiellales bacterium]VGO22900.1 Arylsulfatase [Pontiella sulfatireligans]
MFKRLLVLIAVSASMLQAAEQPNILVVLLDDFGTGHFAPVARQLELDEVDPDFKAYTELLDEPYDQQAALEASRRAMPFMDTLAERGVVFTRAFSASNLCAPARQGVLTGTSPTRWGAYRNIDINVCGLPEGRCLADRFQGLGYSTGFVGKWHVGSKDNVLKKKVEAAGGTDADLIKAGYRGSVCEKDHPLNNGFDYAYFYNLWECPFYNSELIWENREYTGVSTEYNTDLFTRKAMTFMEESLDKGKPFFMELALHAVHIPLDVDAPAAYANRFKTGYKAVDQFYSHIYGVDQSVKRIVDMLKKRGAWDNTILFFLSDNGATCKTGDGDLSLIPGNGVHKGHKGQLYLGGTRIPMMMVWPDKIKTASVIDQNVSSMDVLPTALVAAGATLPDNIDGKNLLPIITNPELTLHDELCWAGIHAPAWGYSSKKTIVNAQEERDRWNGGWAIVEGDYILRFIGTLDPGLEQAYPEGRAAFISLHNMKDDPLEQDDLMKVKPEVAEGMKAKYMKYADTLPAPYRFRYESWAELVPNPGKTPPRKK